MESFLSLPRSAKGGIAVLLVVALLGWAIVAYSAKQQHEDARNFENSLVTLKSTEDREKTALSELQSLEERLSAAETELATSRDAVTAGQQEKSDLEAKLAEFAALSAQSEGALDQGASDQGASDNAVKAAGEGASTDADTLRARLTKTMTALSAKNATLQQRERDLARAQESAESAEVKIQTLAADVKTGEAVRQRLTGTMTTLSAKSAMLQQRERELARALERADTAEAEIQTLMADVETGKAVHERLTNTMTALSAKSAMLQQRDRDIERVKADQASAGETIAALEAALAERDEAGRSLDALMAKLNMTKQALNDGALALKKNHQAVAEQEIRSKELKDELASIEALIGERRAEVSEQEQKLASLADSVRQEEQRLAAQQQETEAANAELANLRAAQEERTSENSSLTAEVDSLQAVLSEKEDAITYAESELERLHGEIEHAKQQLAAKDGEIEARLSMLNAHDVNIQGAEASLAAIKADRAVAEAETIELKTTINRQQVAIEDLAALKGQLDTTRDELVREMATLDETRRELAAADTRLQGIRRASTTRSISDQSLPRIPIVDLDEDSLAVLPIDPMHTPMPVKTENGIRLTLVHFDLGSAELTPGGMRRAKEAAAWIKQQSPNEKIRLVGATDTIGTREDNLVLARRRAQSLLDFFAGEGIDPGRIELISRGEAGGSEVIADQTAEPLNRCVGVFIGEG